MKHDECDELHKLIREYKQIPWWRPFKASKALKEINRRWNLFIEEVCGERNRKSSLSRRVWQENSVVFAGLACDSGSICYTERGSRMTRYMIPRCSHCESGALR